jgi:hypothetical protein
MGLYQTMLAARQQDPERLADDYREIAALVLTIDGLHPEKGHEPFYVVRELMRKRVWCAEPLLSSAMQEVRRVIVLARQWAERVDTPVRGGMSDTQEAFVTAIAAECPGTPHRSCHNHLLRDVAQPVLELDRRAKVKRRSTVRGVRAIERRVLEDRRHTAVPEPPPLHETPKTAAPPLATPPKRLRPRPAHRAIWAWSVRTAPVKRRVGPRLGIQESQTRRARSCAVLVRRCVVCSTTAGAVHCTRPAYA